MEITLWEENALIIKNSVIKNVNQFLLSQAKKSLICISTEPFSVNQDGRSFVE